MLNPIGDLKEIQTQINLLQLAISNLVLKYQKLTNKRTRQELLYQYARMTIGKDASPLDFVTDELGCAESVSNLIRKVIKFPIITGTWTLNHKLETDPRFKGATENNGRGTIIICATGTGNGKIRGHVGILGDNGTIMSSRSSDGIWGIYYTVGTWVKRWKSFGGFRVHYYIIK